jgi:hypothetical protein
LRNIYFDFNKALLDVEDKRELDKVNRLLANYQDLKLVIGAHADARGQDSYNLNLSKKRAKAVGSYLKKQGAGKDRISTEAFGESTPAVPCATNDCSEEEHQKNRRAEFVVSTGNENPEAITESIVPALQITYEEVLEKYGDKQAQGVVFKVVVGAYRYNTTLTFKELQDLGAIESAQENGVTFYYLTGFADLKKAENIRQQIISRGIKDAWIVIFYNGRKISLSKFLLLAKV